MQENLCSWTVNFKRFLYSHCLRCTHQQRFMCVWVCLYCHYVGSDFRFFFFQHTATRHTGSIKMQVSICQFVRTRSDNFIAIAKSDSEWLSLRLGSRGDVSFACSKCHRTTATEVVIVDDCRTATYFSVLADECTEGSTKEQLSLCIRLLFKTGKQITTISH